MSIPAGAASPFRELKLLIANKRWEDLRARLEGVPLWIYDRPLTSDALVDGLSALLDSSADPNIDVVAEVKRKREGDRWASTLTCCLVWGEHDSWTEHELEFDLHLGTEKSNGCWRLRYLGVTPATPEEFAP
jgi:hypothetical protein